MPVSLRRASIVCSLGACLASLPNAAWATPRPLPTTYSFATLPKGEVELEQYVDFDPVKALSTSTGKPTFYGATQFQTEFEIGVTDRLELGLYVTFVPPPGESLQSTPVLPEGNGSKQRLKARFADEGQWPVDLSLYGEVVENEREIEIEAKAIVARRIGRFHVVGNVTGELEAYYAGKTELVFAPSAGVTYQASPAVHPGFEYWVRAEFPTDPPKVHGFNLEAQHYLGPAMLFDFGRAWWSTAVYFRLNHIDHPLEPGDAYGPLWMRTVVGVGF